MTESEWLACDDPTPMLRFLEPTVSDRKLHLYAIASCRRIAPLLPIPASLQGVDVLEQFVEGKATAEEVGRINWDVEGAAFTFDYHDRTGATEQVESWAREVERMPGPVPADLVGDPKLAGRGGIRILTSAAYFVDARVSTSPWERRVRKHPEMLGRDFQSASIVREVFGNPFRPVAPEPAWRTSTVVALANQMYESRDFSPMPILADSLQDAGCDNADMLDHCRDPNATHVRGCWGVDLVLGKS
jgi:hypothetical protein